MTFLWPPISMFIFIHTSHGRSSKIIVYKIKSSKRCAGGITVIGTENGPGKAG